MLSYLRVRGLALLDDVTIELGPGLVVLTGETGAGKSIVVDALALLRGGRARAELVRSGAEACTVDGQFELEGALARRVDTILAEAESSRAAGDASPPGAGPGALRSQDDQDDCGAGRTLVLKRTVPRSGRGRILIDGELGTLPQLTALGEQLIDVCSQHEHQSLTRPGRQLALLDEFAGAGPLLARYEAAYAAHTAARRAQEALARAGGEPAGRADYLRFQLDELVACAPLPGEIAALRARVALLREASAWAGLAAATEEALYQGDDAICGQLARLLARLRELARRSGLDLNGAGADGSPGEARATAALALGAERGGGGPALSARVEALRAELAAALAACAEAAQLAARLGGEIDVEPGELEADEERLHRLLALERKHGSLDDVPALVAALEQELDELGRRDERLAEATERAERTREAALAVAVELSRTREAAAARLGAALTAELALLHLAAARVQVVVTRAPATELGPRGLDRVEILFCANAGEPLAPLSRVASGGELSRVLLALKNVAAGGGPGVGSGAPARATSGVATYVFDEVDAGVGGAVAVAIGQRLRQAAAGSQVLCITHLPQLAAFADAHLLVEKCTRGGRTTAQVRRLDEEERVEELARMLGGSEITTSARAHARQLLADARRAARTPAAASPREARSLAANRSGVSPVGASRASARLRGARPLRAATRAAR